MTNKITSRYIVAAAIVVLSGCSTIRSTIAKFESPKVVADVDSLPVMLPPDADTLDVVEAVDSLNYFTIDQAAADSLFYEEVEPELKDDVVDDPAQAIIDKMADMGIEIEVPRFEGAQTSSVVIEEYKNAAIEDFMIDLRECASHYPADGHVTSNYGWRNRRMHAGIDLKAQKGDNIYAAFDGVVRLAKYNGAYGYCIVIRHYNGLETVYGHSSKLLVEVNQEVKAGDVIALAGSTGRSTGSHLHFEVRVSGLYFDPRLVLDTQNRTIRDTNLYIAVRNGRLFASNNDSQEAREDYIYQQLSIRYHVVKSGDVLSRIAANNQTTVAAICRLNGISSTSVLRIGQRLIVRDGVKRPSDIKSSTPTTAAAPAPVAAPAAKPVASTTNTFTYTIKSGDVLSRIATSNHTTVTEICRINNISRNSTLRIGQKLQLPSTSASAQESNATSNAESQKPLYHTVKSGDTLSGIAKRYHTTVSALCRLNGIASTSTLRISQKILVRAGTGA